MWGRFIFREIAAPERLSDGSMAFSDEHRGPPRATHGVPSFPLETLNTVILAEQDGRERCSPSWWFRSTQATRKAASSQAESRA